jgi:plastocyanin
MPASAPDPQANDRRRKARSLIRAFRLLIVVSASLALSTCAGPDRKRAPQQSETPTAESSAPTQPEATGVSPAASEPTALATTGGTLIGEVMFEGQPPAREPLRMEADAYCQEAQRRPAYSQRVEVNSNGTLKNVFVYAKEGVTGSYAVPTEPVILDQRACQFSPHVFGVQVGQPLRIVNSDATYHNIHAFPRINPEFNIGQPSAGFRTTKQFNLAEVPVRLSCDLHKWMVAYAGVLPHPYFAVTNGAGAFEIKGLLPGNYVIAAWQEKYGLQTQAVTISGEELKTMNFTFRGQHP